MPITKSQLAIILSKCAGFNDPKIRTEQYITDSEIAASVLSSACLMGDIDGKIIADLGAGTGILGIGCMLLGSKMVYFVENDPDAIKVLKQNILEIEKKYGRQSYKISALDVRNYHAKADVVVENPPFGTREKHLDKVFLETAFSIAPIVYSFHKAESESFIKALSADRRYAVTHKLDFNFPIKKSYAFHRKNIERVKVACYRMQKLKI